jgi:hypothetical protein
LEVPTVNPVPFITALEKCFHSPHLAAEIEAIFVTIDYSEKRPSNTRWLITLRGVPPFPGHSDDDEAQEGTMSTIMISADPETGETIAASIPGY